MGAYTIRELENLSGIKAHTIRIWEKRYGLIAPQRTSTNIRTYCESELKKLLNISILNRNGLKISKIAQLSSDEINDRINKYTLDIIGTESQMENLTLSMIDMDEHRFEQVFAKSVIKFGFEEAVIKVLYPFFVKIGLMWQTDSVYATQEHFITNLVKQKLFVALDGITISEKENQKFSFFFLPEGELHELGLLFACFQAKRRGFRTVYLGQTLPLDDLIHVIRNQPIDFLYTTFIPAKSDQTASYMKEIAAKLKDASIYISIPRTSSFDYAFPSNIYLLHGPDQFVAELEKRM